MSIDLKCGGCEKTATCVQQEVFDFCPYCQRMYGAETINTATIIAKRYILMYKRFRITVFTLVALVVVMQSIISKTPKDQPAPHWVVYYSLGLLLLAIAGMLWGIRAVRKISDLAQ